MKAKRPSESPEVRAFDARQIMTLFEGISLAGGLSESVRARKLGAEAGDIR